MTAQEARKLTRKLFLDTLPHLQVGPRMRQRVRLREGALRVDGDRFALHEGRVVRVVAIGKPANEMAATFAEIMTGIRAGVRLRGVVAAPAIPAARLAGFDYFAGGHPYPNEQSWRAAEAALALLDQRNVTPDDLVVFLLSGGGSALVEMPLEPSVTLDDLQQFHRVLVTCGASISEMNTVRKHFSAVKGGRLAQAAWPARQITLYVSDVPEHLPSMVASGPTMPDESTLEQCGDVLKRYALLERFPAIYGLSWESGDGYRRHDFPGTLKPGEACFAQSRYYCLLSNWDAVEKLTQLAEASGVVAKRDLRCDDWDLRDAVDYLLERLEELREESPGEPVALVSGGELRCPVIGDGVGGRNQEFALDCVYKIAGRRVVALSGGTDGVDGNSPACGAIADGESLTRARALGLEPEDYRLRSDSYHFLEKLGDTLITGPTGTNVRDLRILLAYPE
jgi:hydroxypyruvate reductase